MVLHLNKFYEENEIVEVEYVTPLNFRPLNETKTVKDGRKFGCYIKEKERESR